jgi:hypothetical protein
MVEDAILIKLHSLTHLQPREKIVRFV